jgi:hypothetical protein
MSKVSEEIRSHIRKYVMSRSPGMYILLARVANNSLGMDLVDAIIKRPTELLEALKRFYRDDMEATFVFRVLLLRPLALLTGNPTLDDELFKAALNGCQDLVKILRSHGVNIDPNVCD